jgi:hypothetical protein
LADEKDADNQILVDKQALAAKIGNIGLTSLQILREQNAERIKILDAVAELDKDRQDEINLRKLEQQATFQAQEQVLLDNRKLAGEDSFKTFADSFVIHAQRMKMTAAGLAKTMNNVLARGIGNAFTAVGAAFAKGESASDAFADAAQQMAASAASAVGDYYILDGIGRIAKSYGADATGYKMLGAGTALKVLGGALGASGGSSAASISGSGGGGTGTSDEFNDIGEPSFIDEEQDIETASARTVLNLNVEGSLVSEQELAGFLAEVQTDGFGKNGFQVV